MGFRSVLTRLADVGAALAEAVAYRRQEVVVVALLAGSVVAGVAVDAWHRRAPALLSRLEAEPPRLASIARSRPASATEAAPAPAPSARDGPRAVAPAATPAPEGPLDLDAATPDQLARLPGIGPRLAGRIVTRREELGGRFGSFDRFAQTPGLGLRRAARVRLLASVPGETAGDAGPPAQLGGVPP
jgi:DNA uptake protein ComE-like DNA-binding protein